MLAHLLITDSTSAAPRPGEVVVWVGPSRPPAHLARHGDVVRARSHGDAVAEVLAHSPCRLRLQLRAPARVLEPLATSDRRACAA